MQPTCSFEIPICNEQERLRKFHQELMSTPDSMSYSLTPVKHLARSSKYIYRNIVRLFLGVVISFFTVPLHLAMTAGVLIFLLAIVRVTNVSTKWITGEMVSLVSGWTTLILGTLLFCGVQMVMIGWQDYYPGMIIRDIKKRPPYILGKKPIPLKITVDKESN